MARASHPAGVSAVTLGHVTHGTGSVGVVVLHEWLGDHTIYDPLLPYLDGERFRYIFADLRGYGLSREMPGQFSVGEAAGDVLRLMDSLNRRRFHVVGHSMSAMIAQRLAVDASERVQSLVAITPVPASGFAVDAAGHQRMAAVIDDDAAAKAAFTARTSARYGESWLRRKLALARAAGTAEAMRGYLAMFTGTDFAAEVAGLRTPMLAIVGEHDLPVYREENIRTTFGRWYPNLEIVVCREAGHYPMLEAPVFLAAQIERFLAAHASAEAA